MNWLIERHNILDRHVSAVFLYLIMYQLLEPHRIQNLVQEALGTFLSILHRIDGKET